MGNFKGLRVWNDAMELAEKVYKSINENPNFAQDFGLRNQITRAVISVPSNIAEGDERGSNREAVHFFHISKGSVAEVITQLHLARRLGYISVESLDELENLAEKIRASLKNLTQARGGSNPLKVAFWLLIALLKPI